MYAQKSWAEERNSWKAVILLNLVRSANTVADILTETMDSADILAASSDQANPITPLNETHRTLIRKLGVLRGIERDLRSMLGAGASEENDDYVGGTTQFAPSKTQEFTIRSNSGWKGILSRIRDPVPGKESEAQRKVFQVIASSRDDLDRLWHDPATQAVLRNRQIFLEDTAGLWGGIPVPL